MPQLGQNDAFTGSAVEQYSHLDPTGISDWPTKSDVVRNIITNMKMTKVRNMKMPIGSDPLKKKNGKMKKTLPSIPPLEITKSMIPSIINRTPIDR